jgi:hypothetical protein
MTSKMSNADYYNAALLFLPKSPIQLQKSLSTWKLSASQFIMVVIYDLLSDTNILTLPVL